MGKKERLAKPCGTPHPFLHKSNAFRKCFLQRQPARKSKNDSCKTDSLGETLNAVNLPDFIERDAFRYSAEQISENCLIISDTSGLSSESYPSVFIDGNEKGKPETKEDWEDETGSSWSTFSSETEIERMPSVENLRFSGADAEDTNAETWRLAESCPEISKFGSCLLSSTKIVETPTKCRRIFFDSGHSEQEDEIITIIKKVNDEDIIPPLFPEWENEEDIIPPMFPERENDDEIIPLYSPERKNDEAVTIASNQSEQLVFGSPLLTSTKVYGSEVSMKCLPCVSPASRREDDVSSQGKSQNLKDQVATPTQASHHKKYRQAKKRKKFIFNKFQPGENQRAFTAEKSNFTSSEAATSEDNRTIKHVKMKNGDEFRIYFGDYELSVKKTIGSKSKLSESGYAEREDSLNHEKLKLSPVPSVRSNHVNDCRSRVYSLQKKLESTGKANISEILEAIIPLLTSDKISDTEKVITPSLTSTKTSQISEVAISPLTSAKIPGIPKVAAPQLNSANRSGLSEVTIPPLISTKISEISEIVIPPLTSVKHSGSPTFADLQNTRISTSLSVFSAGSEESPLQEAIEREKPEMDDCMMLSANNSFHEDDSQRIKERTKNKMNKFFKNPLNLKGSRASADLQYLPRILTSPSVFPAGSEESPLEEAIEREKPEMDDSMMPSANNSFHEDDSQRTKKKTKSKMNKFFKSPLNLKAKRQSIKGSKKKTKKVPKQQSKKQDKSKMSSGTSIFDFIESNGRSESSTSISSPWPSTSISSPWPSTSISSPWPSTSISSPWPSTSISPLANSSSFQHVYSKTTSDSQNKISRFAETPICPLSLRKTAFEEIEDLSSPPETWQDLENTSVCPLALRPLRR